MPGNAMDGIAESIAAPAPPPQKLRFWQRLDVRLATLFAVVTVVAVVLVGVVVYERQKREVEDGIGTQLLNIARIGALLVDPRVHAQARAARREDSDAYARVQKALV